ncbi:MAG TPA: redoxin domain-containing protein [Phycisphaerae bacterium]|nr:redoxin domain-containing protein [Phycisphaerae bacterium]
MKQFAVTCVVALSLVVGTSALAGLKVGDPAPPLSIKHWIKGEPVDLSKAAPGSIQVVEFWATWCGPCVMGIPHMSEMQEHFKSKGVTFIGVSDEKKETIEKFLAKGHDDDMRYTVAVDDAGKSNKAWMQASGRNGIPCAFVVKDGKVQWIGHPMDEMDEKVAQLCGDTEYAKRKAKLTDLTRKISTAATAEKWDDVHTHLSEYVKTDPGSIQHQLGLYHVLLVKLNKPADATAHATAFIASTEKVDSLNAMAWIITTHEDFQGKRNLDLARSAIDKAMKISKGESPGVLDTYAAVLAESGKIDEAIKAQEKAVALCSADDREMKKELTSRLEEYKRNKKG